MRIPTKYDNCFWVQCLGQQSWEESDRVKVHLGLNNMDQIHTYWVETRRREMKHSLHLNPQPYASIFTYENAVAAMISRQDKNAYEAGLKVHCRLSLAAFLFLHGTYCQEDKRLFEEIFDES